MTNVRVGLCQRETCKHTCRHATPSGCADSRFALAERSSPQQRQALTEEASTSSSALSKQAEPKEAEVVRDEEQKDENYNPVMW